MIRAEKFVEKARKKGYNDLQIKGMFRQKRWKEEDIDKIIKAK